MKDIYDILIIGLGPAGSTLARLLNKKFKIAAIDKKSDNENGFRKPCGGLLATDAQRMLSKFQISLPTDILTSPQIFSVHTIDLKEKLSRFYPRYYINLDREKFDKWMISLIPKNVDLYKECYCSKIEKQDNIYKVTCIKGGKVIYLYSKFIVGSDGANSITKKYLNKNKYIPTYVAIQQVFNDKSKVANYSCIFDSRFTDCYAWGVSKNGKFIFGGAFKKQNCRKNYNLLKQEAADFGFDFSSLIETQACLVFRPRFFNHFYTGTDNIFLIGEAAGFISPSSLEGISNAMDSALTLAKILNKEKDNLNKKYSLKTLPIKVKLVLKNIKIPFMYSPLLRKIIMKTGITSIPLYYE